MSFNPWISTGVAGPASSTLSPWGVHQGAYAAPRPSGDKHVADPKGSVAHEDGGDRTAALFHLRFDDHAVGRAFGAGLEIENFGLEKYGFLELVEVGPLLGRNLHVQRLTAHLLDHDIVLEELGTDASGIGVGTVDLVDGDDHRHVRRLGVVDGFDRLRHDAIVGRDDEDDDVGDPGAAAPHFGEGLVAGRVDEGDLSARRQGHLVGADVLGDAPGLERDLVGLAPTRPEAKSCRDRRGP